jgi:hypothetical protein
MKTHEFVSALQKNPGKFLQFEYSTGHLVGRNYHITEIKNTRIDSVDCGGKTDNWNETIVQLWESPVPKVNGSYLKAGKALGILEKVHSVKPMDPDAEIKFEYGNSRFHAAQLLVSELDTRDEALLVKLSTDKTNCKAREDCRVPVRSVKQKETAGCCSPGTGCC